MEYGSINTLNNCLKVFEYAEISAPRTELLLSISLSFAFAGVPAYFQKYIGQGKINIGQKSKI